MYEYILFLVSLLTSLFLTYSYLPKRNPYYFPQTEDIDKFTYVDDVGVCYEYKRIYE